MSVESTHQEPLSEILGLPPPWVVKTQRFNPTRRQLDVWIAPTEQQARWFRAARPVFLTGPEQSWRHLDIGHWHTVVHAIVPTGYTLDDLTCVGDIGQPFSRGLAKFLFELLYNGVELGAICSLYGISLDQLWRFKFGLDNGRISIDAPPQKGRVAAVGPTVIKPPAGTAVGTSEPLPDASHPVWYRLATGDLNIDIRVLSLKLLLTRVRSQMSVIHDDNVRELKVAELYRYFSKNARMLTHELSQFQGAGR